MNLLGFDTSTAATAACLLRADGEAFEVAPDVARLGEPPAHARELLPALEELLERGGMAWSELDSVAVGVGPGSFTGLRIGIATARALAVARGLELRPVSSLAALAAGIEARARLPLIDARRGELAGALYDVEQVVWEEFIASPAQVAERLRSAPVTPLAAGDGSIRFREALEAVGVEVAPDEAPAHVVRGLQVCRLAAEQPAAAPEAVLPQYLRFPDTS